MRRLIGFVVLCAASVQAQVPAASVTTILCDEGNGCTHFYLNGELFKTITTKDGTVITAGLAASANGKYMRLNVTVFNGTNSNFDLLPSDFQIKLDEGSKEKMLTPIPPEEIAKSAERGAGWHNYFNRVGAALAHNTSTTNTSSSSTTNGTVRATSSDGTYTNGTYNGTTTGSSTSTTTTPDYQARAIAEQRIADRNAKVATANDQMMQTALTANTLVPGQAIGGYVYFKSTAANGFHPRIVIAGKVYEFDF
jgi:hypothetical protein